MTGRVAGKVAVVTGAGSGIGAATATVLAREGASVVLADVNVAAAEAHAVTIRAAGGNGAAVMVDMNDEDSVRSMIQWAVDHFGGLDILHNNALGVPPMPGGSPTNGSFQEMEASTFDAFMHGTVTTTMVATKHAIAHLLAGNGGSIINTASAAGLRGSEFNPAYGAGKAGVIQLTRSIAAIYGAEGVRCNAICPGLILTPAGERAIDEAGREMFLRQTPSPRLGRPEDVANLVLYLASDESAFMNGQALVLDGGGLMHEPLWADRRAAIVR